MKIVVFDLDETLGYFTQLGVFWDHLGDLVGGHQLTQEAFNEVMDLFPEYLRPNIINILIYLKHKKNSKCCHKMMIYTNNNGPREWAEQIVRYFEDKLHFSLIDQIVAAFKVNGKQIEVCRTTHNKTHQDFMRCTKIPPDTEICFIDDSYHPHMSHHNIYYIHIKPYYYDIPFEEMVQRFSQSSIGRRLTGHKEEDMVEFAEKLVRRLSQPRYDIYLKTDAEKRVDEVIGTRILYMLKQFFAKSLKNATLKKQRRRKNKTFKTRETG